MLRSLGDADEFAEVIPPQQQEEAEFAPESAAGEGLPRSRGLPRGFRPGANPWMIMQQGGGEAIFRESRAAVPTAEQMKKFKGLGTRRLFIN